MGGQGKKKGLFFWLEFISKIVAIPAFILSLFTFVLHSCEIDNLKKLNKQHLDPNLFLMVYDSGNEASTIRIQNISILPAVEIYVKKYVYFCSKDAKRVYCIETEDPGWYTKELLPTKIQTKDIKKEEKEYIIRKTDITANAFKINGNLEPVIEFCVEFHRQSDLKKYTFRQMYFLKDLNLIWSEEGSVKNVPYYSNLFRLISSYKFPYKLPNVEDLGRYKVDSKWMKNN